MGPQGAQGNTGAVGATGATGQGFNFAGGYTGGTYNAYDVVTENGSTYEATTQTTEDPATSVMQADGQWVVFALEGTTGPQGQQGNVGATGPQGDTGSQGPIGPTGQQGGQGPQGETGPMGPQGFQGVTGPQGDTGAVGATGATGQGFNFAGGYTGGTYNAYDVVTENGSTYEATTQTTEDPAHFGDAS